MLGRMLENSGKTALGIMGAISLFIFLVTGINRVPPGHVGIKVNLLGDAKGVVAEELGTGIHFLNPITKDMYLFPIFQQNYVWTQDKREESPTDESFTFQTKEGLQINTDMGITLHLERNKVPLLFQTYRKGINEITTVFLRNHVRDALNKHASSLNVEDIYSTKKNDFLDAVKKDVSNAVAEKGIIVDNIYIIGAFRLPKQVVDALNSKIEANQRAQQRENEVKESAAQAQKEIEKAKGEAQAILTVAQAQAKANEILSKSLTPNLIEYKKIEKWSGTLPTVSSDRAMIMIGQGK